MRFECITIIKLEKNEKRERGLERPESRVGRVGPLLVEEKERGKGCCWEKGDADSNLPIRTYPSRCFLFLNNFLGLLFLSETRKTN